MNLTFDTNRLSRLTQRRFNTAWMLMRGETVRLLPRVAWEVMGKLILPEILDADRERLIGNARLLHNVESHRQRMKRTFALWWADELSRRDSPYDLIEMNPEQREIADEICLAIDPKAFPRISPEEVPDSDDTITIAEALVTGQNMLVTGNMNSILHHEVNLWAERNASIFGFRHPEVLHDQDTVMPCMYRGEDGRRRLLSYALGACWPDSNGDRPDAKQIEKSLYGLTGAMARGAGLANTATVIERTWEAVDRDSILNHVADHLPHRMFASERRHPARGGGMRGGGERPASSPSLL